MADIFTASNVYQGTFVAGTVEVDPVYQICAVANINASNQLEISFWINRNGERVDSGLGLGSYVLKDKSGALISGISQSNISADLSGYYHTTAVSAGLIYDLNHYLLEIEIAVGSENINSSIGLIRGE